MAAVEKGKLIVNLLSENLELMKAINGNIFPIISEDEIDFPFIVYRRTSQQQSETFKQGQYKTIYEYEISVIAGSYSKSVEIAEMVNETLDGRETDLYDMEVSMGEESFINAFIQNLNLTITYYE